ncbi:hypothetical protein [Sphingomonas elodea]|uniref:hypothetical protein n=1 Tax=Sphingomonas elodea TaxID=179878 RepID=UPI001ED94873|nr:hypothetical protein [Sphingomonas elodea]
MPAPIGAKIRHPALMVATASCSRARRRRKAMSLSRSCDSALTATEASAGVQPVAARHRPHDGANRRGVPALFAAGGKAAGEVGRAGLDDDGVRRPGMLHLVHLEPPLVDQADGDAVAGLPAKLDGEHGALGRQGEPAVAVVEHQVELVGAP